MQPGHHYAGLSRYVPSLIWMHERDVATAAVAILAGGAAQGQLPQFLFAALDRLHQGDPAALERIDPATVNQIMSARPATPRPAWDDVLTAAVALSD